jgi:TonB family protein
MKNVRTSTIMAIVSIVFAAQFCLAQSSGAESAKERTFWPESPLVAPVYPPLARQARIMGDVKVRIGIHRDGSVTSAEVVSGPLMLQPAALASAQKSKFYCWPDCTDEVTTFDYTYTFGMRESNYGCDNEQLRAAKCLYLWRCGPWRSIAAPAPTIGSSINRIIVLADPTCVETSAASNSRNTPH